jgi:hypothetical protein
MAYRASYGADTYGSSLYGVTGAIDGSTDVTYRPAYGKATYGTAVYGAEGNETITLTGTCSAQILIDGAAAASSTLTAASQATRIIEGSASASLQNLSGSVGEVYAETDGYRTGYGLRSYGTSIYGENVSVEVGVASASATLTSACSFELVREASALATENLTGTCNAVFSVRGSATGSMSLLGDAAPALVMLAAGSGSMALSSAASGIEKWEPVDEVTDTWTPVAVTSETWTPVTWSRAA